MNVVSITEAITPTSSPELQQTPHLRTKSLYITQGLFLQHFWLWKAQPLSTVRKEAGCVLKGTTKGALHHLLQQKHWKRLLKQPLQHSSLFNTASSVLCCREFVWPADRNMCHLYNGKAPLLLQVPCGTLDLPAPLQYIVQFNTEHVYKAYFFFH